MLNLLFSPSGRINSADSYEGRSFLVAFGFVLSLPEIMGMKILAAIMGILSYILVYPWVVLWIKRYHDAGKSGWMCLLPIIAYCFLMVIAVIALLGGDIMTVINAATDGASQAEQTALMEST